MCDSTWDTGSTKLQHELMQFTEEWKWLGFSGDCPYPTPSEKDQASHSKKYGGVYNDIVEITTVLADALAVDAADGWGFPKDWALREEEHKKLCLDFVKTLESGEEDAAQVMTWLGMRKMWRVFGPLIFLPRDS